MPSVRASVAILGLVAGVALLSGCAATSTAVAKRNLDVQTKMSDTIFLDPVPADERTVYLEVKNTSDKPDFDMTPQVRDAVGARGFRLVDDPRQANFILQVNVLQAGRSSPTAAEQAYNGGFGSTVLGGAAGGAVGYGVGAAGVGVNNTLGLIIGALLGSAISTISDSYVQDTTYTIVTDLQISERATSGVVVSQSEQANLKQGTGGTVTQSSSQTTDMKRYRTRIVSTAEKVNLDWPQAAPDLTAGMTRSIAGVL